MQKPKMRKTEERLYNSKNPNEYISNSLKVKLSPQRRRVSQDYGLKKPVLLSRKYNMPGTSTHTGKRKKWKEVMKEMNIARCSMIIQKRDL